MHAICKAFPPEERCWQWLQLEFTCLPCILVEVFTLSVKEASSDVLQERMGRKVSRRGEEEKVIMFGLDWNASGRKMCLKKDAILARVIVLCYISP